MPAAVDRCERKRATEGREREVALMLFSGRKKRKKKERERERRKKRQRGLKARGCSSHEPRVNVDDMPILKLRNNRA